MNGVDFSYAFAAPHALTLCRPSSGRKLITWIEEKKLHTFYAYKDLTNIVPLTWDTPRIDMETEISFYCNGEPVSLHDWHRHNSGAPYLIAEGGECLHLEAVGADCGAVFSFALRNDTREVLDIAVRVESLRGWVITNLGWIDGVHNNILMTEANGRADRLIALADGADDYPMYRGGKTVSGLPMPESTGQKQQSSMRFVTMHFRLQPEESKTGYLCLPYETYLEELPTLSATDWKGQMTAALREWTDLLDKGMTLTLPDDRFVSAARACLADLFVMREPVEGGYGISPGTMEYRSVQPGEPLMAENALERWNYIETVTSDLPVYLDKQDDNGCWVWSKGWVHDMWEGCQRQAYTVMNHYALTGDRAFLEKYYERMKRSTLFNAASRKGTENDPVEAHRGLMQRGMGDCGLMSNGDYYGVFYCASAMTIAADEMTLKAARILDKTEDIPMLEDICTRAREALTKSIRQHAVKEDGYSWIPAAADIEPTSFYGCLDAFYPAYLFEADDPLIVGTWERIRRLGISDGGLPLGLGWMKDGIWAAIALDNISEALLRMGRRDEAASFLYPVINHASPLVTWCEERGKEPGSDDISGDHQHLWTPMAVCTYVLDALFCEEDDRIMLFAGTPRGWLDEDGTVGCAHMRTSLGDSGARITRAGDVLSWELSFERPVTKPMTLYLRTSEKEIIIENPAVTGSVSLK